MAMSEADLIAILKANPPANKFVPYCYLNKDSDSLTVYFEGDADYSERVNDHLTIYRSLDTKELVGCRIKGISGIIEDMPNYLHYDRDGIQLSVLFFAFRGGLDQEKSGLLKSLADAANDKNLTLEPA